MQPLYTAARQNSDPHCRIPSAIYSTLVFLLGLLTLAATGAHADDVAYGEYLSSSCLTCHSLTDTTQAMPALNSYDETAMIHLLTHYRDGEDLNPAMQSVARSLSDEEIRALAIYFEQLKSQ